MGWVWERLRSTNHWNVWKRKFLTLKGPELQIFEMPPVSTPVVPLPFLSIHCQVIRLTKQWTLCSCRKDLFSLLKDPPSLWKLQSSFILLLICFVFQNPIPPGNSYSFYGVGEYTLWIFPGTAVSPSTQALIIVLIIMFQLFKISLLSSIVWDIILSQHDKFSYTL